MRVPVALLFATSFASFIRAAYLFGRVRGRRDATRPTPPPPEHQ